MSLTNAPRLSSARAEGRPLRRRLHALRGPGPSSARRATGALGERHGLDARPGPLRGRAARRDRRRCSSTPSSSTTRSSGSRSPSRSSAGWAATPAAPRACAVEIVRAWERHENFSLYEDALPVLDELRAPRAQDRAHLERPARPRRVRRAPRARRRRRGRFARARPVKPHASIFVAALERARRRARGGGDGRRLLRGRHRGRARARDAGDPARPRRAVTPATRTASTTCSRCRRPSASRQLTPSSRRQAVRVLAEWRRGAPSAAIPNSAAALPRASRPGRRRRPRRRSSSSHSASVRVAKTAASSARERLLVRVVLARRELRPLEQLAEPPKNFGSSAPTVSRRPSAVA